ncbi:glycoside hydrolase family 19 protein [Paraburkholderia sp. 2C]
MLQPLEVTCDRFSISTPLRVAAFLAQVGHESSGLKAMAESFNYSVAALPQKFRKMTPALASILGRQPGETMVPIARQQKIANIAYANQYGNGDSSSGDGWAYRGSGLIQLTFRGNFEACSDDLNLDLITNPDRARTDDTIAALVSGWFWAKNGCNTLADAGSFDSITRRINKAMAGKTQRDALYAAARQALSI